MSTDKLSQAIGKINARLSANPLFFLAPEVERGLGLEEMLTNYYILAHSEDYLSKHFEDKGIARVFPVRNSAKLTGENFVDFLHQKYPQSIAHKFGVPKTHQRNFHFYLQLFKNIGFEKELLQENKLEWTLLNNEAGLTRKLENKVNQYEILKKTKVEKYLPAHEYDDLQSIELDELRTKYGDFAIQLPFGHTGSSTYLIFRTDQGLAGEESIKRLKAQYPRRSVRIVSLISGHSYTVNACNYRGQTFVSGISYQYTGIVGLTNNPATTVGNDWALPAKLLTKEKRSEIIELTEQIGKILRQKFNFKGMFGLDLIVEDGTQNIKLIEINPRQVASIPMHAKLQLQRKEIPLNALHLAEFLTIDLDINAYEYNQMAMEPWEAAQLFLRANNENIFEIPKHNVISGIYRQQGDNKARELISQDKRKKVIFLDNAEDRPLIWQGDAYTISDFHAGELLLIVKPIAARLNKHAEMARIQAQMSLGFVDSQGAVKLRPVARDTMFKLREIMS